MLYLLQNPRSAYPDMTSCSSEYLFGPQQWCGNKNHPRKYFPREASTERPIESCDQCEKHPCCCDTESDDENNDGMTNYGMTSENAVREKIAHGNQQTNWPGPIPKTNHVPQKPSRNVNRPVNRPIGLVNQSKQEKEIQLELQKESSPVGLNGGNCVAVKKADSERCSEAVYKTLPSAEKLNCIASDLVSLALKIYNLSVSENKDKEYIYIDEMLTKALLSLDAIESNGDDEVRNKRKQLVNRVYFLLESLERKQSEIEPCNYNNNKHDNS